MSLCWLFLIQQLSILEIPDRLSGCEDSVNHVSGYIITPIDGDCLYAYFNKPRKTTYSIGLPKNCLKTCGAIDK